MLYCSALELFEVTGGQNVGAADQVHILLLSNIKYLVSLFQFELDGVQCMYVIHV